MRPGVSSRYSLAAMLAMLALVLCLVGCGTQGNAPPLGTPANATLTSLPSAGSSGAVATVVLKPFNALHVTVYYRGNKLPTVDARTPAQLRESSCAGPVVAPITVSAFGATAPGSTSSLVSYSPDPAGGMDISEAPSGNLYVVVLNPQANLLTGYLVCGAPLSGQNQYFDLYPPQVGNAGIALGTALMSPIAATALSFSITRGTFQPVAWAVHTGSCTGAVQASGSFEAKTAKPTGVIYQNPQAHRWWIILAGAGGQTLCGQVA
ncbi:MAG: hypothetical protein ACLQUY_24010 [Ktedonobacterales bacterium]